MKGCLLDCLSGIITTVALAATFFLPSIAHSSQLTLTWEKPDDSRVAGYHIYCGQSGTAFKLMPFVKIYSQDTTSYTFSNLEAGFEYSFSATSFDSEGNESDFSETIRYFIRSAIESDSDTQTRVFGDAPDAGFPGTIQDTFININADVNYSSDQLNTYTWPANMPANAILIEFDLSSLPADARIQSATLSLYQTAAGGDASYDVGVHKVINHKPDLFQANGYTCDGVNGWTANNSCYNSIPLAQNDIASAEDVNCLDLNSGYKEWKVTNMVQEWVSNSAMNYGLLLNSDVVAGSGSHRFFQATEAIDAAQRPRLEVIFTSNNNDADINDIDNDEDGYAENEGDFNDNDSTVYPGAIEICGDGIDQDCNGSDLMCAENIDNDGDGYAGNEGDCNDNDVSVYPGAIEICGDGLDQDCDGSDLECIQDDTPGFVLETGEVEVDEKWVFVAFTKTYAHPVIVAKPISLNGGHPAVIRIKNVTQVGFEIRIQEWDYLDGAHAYETAGYMVMEAGHHLLPNGINVEAGIFESGNTQKTVCFKRTFSQIPVVISSVTTENELDAVTGRIFNITYNTFDIILQEEEIHKNDHKTNETISYIAWEPSSGEADGMNYIVDSTFNEVTHELYHIPFYPSFENVPVFVADMQTKNGGETANVRWENKNADGIEVMIHEEQSLDIEVRHIDEVIGFMAFDAAAGD